MFQSTLPRGERPDTVSVGSARGRVSIHAPAGGATYEAFLRETYGTVSIHAPAGGATVIASVSDLHFLLFQSTLPRGERHRLVTFTSPRSSFNPRSRGGSDLAVDNRPDLEGGFNPRSRGGSDAVRVWVERVLVSVSIHAPAGGATSRLLRGSRSRSGFNPRSRGGSDMRCRVFCMRSF